MKDFWEVEEAIDVEDEEAPPRRILRDPGEPTKAEWDSHRVDHIPFRSWCPHCVRGRGTGLQHRRIKEENRVQIFGFDYLLGTRAIEDDLQEDDKKYLEINDRLSKKWPLITEAKAAPDDAKEWENKPNKLNLLEE